MAAKDVFFADKARQQMLAGVNILADAVKATSVQRAATSSLKNPSAHRL
jgi:chaperonin GroEL (HSP60 family)